MEILFEVGSYRKTLENYWNVLTHEMPYQTPEADDEFFVIRPYRAVIPELGLSFREGEWFVKEPDFDTEQEEEDETEDWLEGQGDNCFDPGLDGWKSRGNVIILYDENEDDISNMLDYTTAGLDYTLGNYLRRKEKEVPDLSRLQCIIETDEFMDENTAYMFWPQEEDDEESEI